MKVTIKDVARQANVATSTVSRVISNSPKISEETKRRVRKVMDEMGYYLNYNGRILVSQSTQTIGIVTKSVSVQSFDNLFFTELLKGISEASHEQDYSIYLTTGNEEETIYNEVIKMVKGKRVDGVIVLYSKEDDKVVPFLRENNIPFVVLGKPVAHTSETMYVDNDNVQASKEATNYLIDLGHTNIGFIGGDSHYEVARDRLEGYKQAIRAKGWKLDKNLIKNLENHNINEEEVVEELISGPEPPTGLVVTSDFNALKVMRYLGQKGIKIPEEMSVIGFNNTMISQLTNPPLTTVDTQSFQLGHESARNLIDLLKHPSTLMKSIIIPTVIIERDSCARHQASKK
ncbi:LacI family transcriptional regulator [Halobacillus salinarum]|uniref:LacI family transcriptional regulator n=1 Tax=Halobacillus salinarum TaxID=2932257 RepID=A0ABY4EL38_9BACI|nr:LacI family DNA-binding transcriptional regulator [Halobacillus salinarum]UOQ44818.1 LacI family transcriptional regulator [Halobacillus salinarum]